MKAGVLNTLLELDDVEGARAFAGELEDGLESGRLEPTAAALEPLADRV